jgi:hypothetical protein
MLTPRSRRTDEKVNGDLRQIFAHCVIASQLKFGAMYQTVISILIQGEHCFKPPVAHTECPEGIKEVENNKEVNLT